ncbi:hypothetical protein MHM88_14405 [Epibacterium sp. MM17-32]|uniref:hypothetical protein n=1 Tax=Epibacterium sp. MM17-32 TaxID=2917734 RepID=UPI001EF5114F|nr:hypothetical protein [Epibacterium sp. MM17-32]MCG7629000.1 hypothetical protein [Epibacterium sp. MM17-32]
MAIIGQGISLRGMVHEKFHYPFYLASGITNADVGKAVALDSSAANTVKLAGDDDKIIGKLVTHENRSVEGVLVGTVALRGGFRFTKAAAAPAINVGDTVVGAGGGEVKAAASADHADNMVVEVDGDNIIVVR